MRPHQGKMRPVWAICTKSGQQSSGIGGKKFNNYGIVHIRFIDLINLHCFLSFQIGFLSFHLSKPEFWYKKWYRYRRGGGSGDDCLLDFMTWQATRWRAASKKVKRGMLVQHVRKLEGTRIVQSAEQRSREGRESSASGGLVAGRLAGTSTDWKAPPALPVRSDVREATTGTGHRGA